MEMPLLVEMPKFMKTPIVHENAKVYGDAKLVHNALVSFVTGGGW